MQSLFPDVHVVISVITRTIEKCSETLQFLNNTLKTSQVESLQPMLHFIYQAKGWARRGISLFKMSAAARGKAALQKPCKYKVNVFIFSHPSLWPDLHCWLVRVPVVDCSLLTCKSVTS